MTFQITRAFKGLGDELQRAQKRCCLAGEAQARMWGLKVGSLLKMQGRFSTGPCLLSFPSSQKENKTLAFPAND